MQSDAVRESKPYSPPGLTKLTVEEAMQVLAASTGCGSQDASDLLQLLSEELQERQRLLDAN